MAVHQIPRNVKGESRILMVFSIKGLIYTGVGALIGCIFYLFLKSFGLNYLGFGIMVAFGAIGFVIGTFKIPTISTLAFTQKVGGENIDDVIKRAIKFKLSGRKIYVYDTKGETKDEQ